MSQGSYQTQSRTKILEYLRLNSNRAVRASDISEYLTSLGMKVNITTIYRYLDRLEQDGSIMKYVSQKGAGTLYQLIEAGHACQEHLHLRCSKCGAVIHLECEFMDELLEHITTHHGFHLDCGGSVLIGVCDKCRCN